MWNSIPSDSQSSKVSGSKESSSRAVAGLIGTESCFQPCDQDVFRIGARCQSQLLERLDSDSS